MDFRKGKAAIRRLQVTRDHIVPKSLGGSALESNTRLAHSYCNNKRGAGTITDALRETCRRWIIQNVPAHDIERALQYFLKFKVPPTERAVRMEPDWWKSQHKDGDGDIFLRSFQGGLCNGH